MDENLIIFWTMIGTVITGAATVGLVIGAYLAWRTARNTLRQMKQDSIAQTRPYLYASLVPGLAGPGMYDLLIQNTGSSAAYHVRVSSSDYPNDPDDIAQRLKPLLDAEHTIPPGTRIRNYWRLTLMEGHTWDDGTNNPAGMPEKAELTLEYEDFEQRKYRDIYNLDTVALKFAPVPKSGPNARAGLSDYQQDTHEMLAVIAEALGELRR